MVLFFSTEKKKLGLDQGEVGMLITNMHMVKFSRQLPLLLPVSYDAP